MLRSASSPPAPEDPARDLDAPALVAIGNFDGVHRGHQAVLGEARREAAARSLRPRVLTFDPHPAAVLGRPPPATLTRPARKEALIRRMFPEISVVTQRFDVAFAAKSPEAFAREILVDALRCRVVIVGHNFRFGQGRAGDFAVLTALGDQLGFETRSHAMVSDEQGHFSSTRAREAIRAGDVEGAARVLGRPHAISGIVERGDQRGRLLGFPTCNLGDVVEALPANGVYAVLVDRGDRALAPGVANVGVRPTVKETPRVSVEVHLFEIGPSGARIPWEGDVYGEALRVHFVRRLREERRFQGVDALRAQIAIDADEAAIALAASMRPADGPWC